MTEREIRDLAWRLADVSEVFDFDKALEFVRFEPAEAEELIRARKESQKRMAELDRAYERLHRAVLQEFG
ncbi:MAG: hypothetical protein ACTHNP_11405 [Solirubrobacterales bacterium]